MTRLTERHLKALDRHREVGHPPFYQGPCWGPTTADYAHVDAAMAKPPPKETKK